MCLFSDECVEWFYWTRILFGGKLSGERTSSCDKIKKETNEKKNSHSNDSSSITALCSASMAIWAWAWARFYNIVRNDVGTNAAIPRWQSVHCAHTQNDRSNYKMYLFLYSIRSRAVLLWKFSTTSTSVWNCEQSYSRIGCRRRANVGFVNGLPSAVQQMHSFQFVIVPYAVDNHRAATIRAALHTVARCSNETKRIKFPNMASILHTVECPKWLVNGHGIQWPKCSFLLLCRAALRHNKTCQRKQKLFWCSGLLATCGTTFDLYLHRRRDTYIEYVALHRFDQGIAFARYTSNAFVVRLIHGKDSCRSKKKMCKQRLGWLMDLDIDI